MTFIADERATGALVIPCGPALEGHHFHIVTTKAPSNENVEAVREWLASEAAPFVERPLSMAL